MNEATAEPITADGMAVHADGHSHNNGFPSIKDSQSPSLTSSFDPLREAEFFLRLLRHGAVTYKRACDAIEMKGYQRDWLIQNGLAERFQIELLFDLRQRTLVAFKTLASEYGIGPDDSQQTPAALGDSRPVPFPPSPSVTPVS